MTQSRTTTRNAADTLSTPLPEGERVIWQGRPSAARLALRAFHIREVAIYFILVMGWKVWSSAMAGTPAAEALIAASWLVVPAFAALAVLSGLAYAFARAARYTITSRRVVLQFGVALPMTLNIPLTQIAGAALKTYQDGSGDIPLTLTENKGSFLLLWPHVRPWHLSAVQPMLRAVPDAARVAAQLAEALTGAPAPATISLTPAVATDRIYAAGDAAVAA